MNINLNSLKNNPTLLIAGAAASISALAALYYFFSERSSSGKDGEVEPAIPLETVHDIMTEMLDKIKFLAVKTSRALPAIKQQFGNQLDHISDRDILKMFMLQHFEGSVGEIQEQLLQEHGVDEDELEEATNYYANSGDKLLGEILEKIKKIHYEFGGDSLDDDDSSSKRERKTLAFDTIIEILESLSDKVADATEAYVTQFKKVHGLPTSYELKEKFQVGMIQLSDQCEKEILDSYDLTQADFQEAIVLNQSNPLLQQTVMALQYKNQQQLMRHGIQMQ